MHPNQTQATHAGHAAPPPEALQALARSHGLVTTFTDGMGQARETPIEAVLALLRAQGSTIRDVDDAPRALTERCDVLARPRLDEVIVAWDGRDGTARLLGVDPRPRTLHVVLHREDGSTQAWDVAVDTLRRDTATLPDGRTREDLILPLPEMPLGHHTLTLHDEGATHTATVLSAPRRAPTLPATETATWGVFAPLYAVRETDREPMGDLTTLRHLLGLVAERGGRVAATLPLLPAFLQDRMHDPSPYGPVSRRFWHELYIDPVVEPEYDHPDVQALLREPGHLAERARLAEGVLVDPRGTMRWKRPVLDRMAAALDATPGDRRDEWHDWVHEHPEIETYARFRAACEARDAPWQEWPDVAAELAKADPARVRTHTYAQWLAERQMQALGTYARTHGLRIALDLPLGAHPDGFDAWQDRALYASGATVGAPPDGFFVHGQDWGFAPYSPDALRAAGYAPLLQAILHHTRHAGILRIDHVMGLHRLYWIPRGARPDEGAYVNLPAPEIYAVLLLAAHRHDVVLQGEDLGTVPPEVPAAMHEHGLLRSYVFQIEAAFANGVPRIPPAGTVASLGTHDMPTFAAFWTGTEYDDRLERGLLDPDAAQREREGRRDLVDRLSADLPRAAPPVADAEGLDETRRGYAYAAAFLANAPTPLVLLDLGDLLGETQPHNRPGTPSTNDEGPPNWRRRIAPPLDALAEDDDVRVLMHGVHQVRRHARPAEDSA